jgi:glycosyltransferase involved in cell wall biosynthesis
MTVRVLHVIPAIAPRYGGPSAAIIGMCRALNAGGTSTLIATTDADGPSRLDLNLGRVQKYQDVDVIAFRRTASEAFKWSWPLGHWLRHAVSDFDLVHIHAVFSHSSIAAGRACRRRGVPYVVRPLGTLDPWSLRQKSVRKTALMELGARALLTGAAAIHYTSEDERQLAESAVAGLPPGTVVPIGIDEDLFVDSDASRAHTAPYVLSLSRLAPKKNLELLIAAFHEAAAADRFQPWTLVVAGDGEPEYVGRIKALANAGAARDRIRFSGWITVEAKRVLLGRAAVFALPSSQENFGISVAEAMASRVPVIVTPGVNLAEAIAKADAGWIVEQEQGALAEALRVVMGSPDVVLEKGRRANGLALRYRWASVATQLTHLYERVLSVQSAGAAQVAR